VGQLLALTTGIAAILAFFLKWPLVVLAQVGSVIFAAPLGVPLFFVGTMLNDKKTCTARFLLAFVVSECIAVVVVFAFTGLVSLLMVPRE